MIIHSTTLDTMEKVIAIYGGTTWKKVEGRMLLGQSSSYAINSTGGSATNTLSVVNLPSHAHSVGAHSHGLNGHTHSIPALSGSTNNTGSHSHTPQIISGYDGVARALHAAGVASGSGHTVATIGEGDANWWGITTTDGGHTHTVTTTSNTTGAAGGSTANSAAFNSGSTGSGTAINNMPPYKAVYIWERTA